MKVLDEISAKLQQGKAEDVKKLVQQALDQKVAAGEILEKGLIAGMSIIGGKFKRNEVYVPEVLIAARAMHAGLGVLEPALAKAGVEPLAKVSIGTVKGDLHDIGKNLVAMLLRGAGFKVEDLKIDVSAEKFVEAARNGSQLICLSALLTTTMPQMKVAIDAMKASGLNVPVLVGGAPVTQGFADEIGASGYAADAASAVDKAKELLNLV